MNGLIDILLLIGCIAIIYQDFKYRSIYWYWLPMILIALVSKHLIAYNYEFFTHDLPLNLALLISNGIAVTLYFSLKNKRWINPIDTLIGKGDIYLYVVMALAFSFPVFVVFFMSSLLIPLMVSLTTLLIKKRLQRTIPLAAYTCIVFVLLQILNYLPKNPLLSIDQIWHVV